MAVSGVHSRLGLGQDQAPGESDIHDANSLRARAATRGLLAGCAVDMPSLHHDAAYRQLLAEQYDILVGENCMKFGPMQPKADTYNFVDADALLAFAESHHMKLRGHNFVWHESLPAWFTETVTKENARKVMTDHITTIASRYKGKIHSWDVVNEAIWIKDGRADGLRSSSPWFELVGPDYIEIAFKTARQADPSALLTYNDYGIEYDDAENTTKRHAVLNLLRRLKDSGTPIDALGIQSHIHAGGDGTFSRGVHELTAGAQELGLQVFITELDVKDDSVGSDNPAVRDRAVAAVYGDYLGDALQSPAVKAILTWGVTDSHTWLNSGTKFRPKHPQRDQRPLPFDADLKPKPAYFAIRDAINKAARR